MRLLEPIARPRVGIVLNLLGMLVAFGATLLSATVTTVGGVVPMVVLAPLVAFGFLSRLVGAGIASSRGVRSMPWTPRILSWSAFGLAGVLLGLAGSLAAVAVLGAFIALDAAAGLTKRSDAPQERRPGPGLWARAKLPLLLGLYMGGVAAFHFLVAIYLPFGVLVTWSLLALAFAFAVRLMLNGPKADEAWLRAPLDHRVHERREEVVADPHRQKAEEVLLSLRARGDAGAFLDYVRQAARSADLPDAEMDALESRILASFARAGTGREEDVRAALLEVESALALRTTTRSVSLSKDPLRRSHL